MAKIITVAIQKGGVGKTSVVTNLAAAMAGVHGQTVLVIDMDAQRSATLTLLGQSDGFDATVLDVLLGKQGLPEALIPSPHHDRLLVLPGSAGMSVQEKRMSASQWDMVVDQVQDLLRESVPDDIDVVLIDTPTALSLWLHASLAAADGYLIVAKCEPYCVPGIGQLTRTAASVRDRVNPELRIAGMVVNEVRPTRLHTKYRDGYRRQFGDAVLQPAIPIRVAMAEAQDRCVPLEFFDEPGARELRDIFRALAGEVLRRMDVAPATTAS